MPEMNMGGNYLFVQGDTGLLWTKQARSPGAAVIVDGVGTVIAGKGQTLPALLAGGQVVVLLVPHVKNLVLSPSAWRLYLDHITLEFTDQCPCDG